MFSERLTFLRRLALLLAALVLLRALTGCAAPHPVPALTTAAVR